MSKFNRCYIEEILWLIETSIASKMLGHMKSIKFSGLASKLSASVAQMRVDEMTAAQPFRTISVCSASLAQISVLLSPVAAFAVFAIVALGTGETFEATRLFFLLASPLFVTFEVIQEYLCREPRHENRHLSWQLASSLMGFP